MENESEKILPAETAQNLRSSSNRDKALADIFREAADSERAACKGERRAAVGVTWIYHAANDEAYAVKRAKQQAEASCRVTFSNFDDQTVKTLRKDNPADGKDKAQQPVDWKYWLGLIVDFLLTVLTLSITVSVKELRENLILMIVMCVLTGLFGLFLIALLVQLIRVAARHFPHRQARGTNNFRYGAKNVVYLVHVPVAGVDRCFEAFREYVKSLPPKRHLTCILLRPVGECPRTVHASSFYENLFQRDKTGAVLNAENRCDVAGYYLVPISREEKILLAERLGLDKIIIHNCLAYGRDYLYQFALGEARKFTQDDYEELLARIVDALSKSPEELRSKDNAAFLVSFLARFHRLCFYAFPQDTDAFSVKSTVGNEFFGTLAKQFFGDGSEQNRLAVRAAADTIVRRRKFELSLISDYEDLLLAGVTEGSSRLDLLPMSLALQCFFEYLNKYDIASRNEYYFRAAFEVNSLTDNLIAWNNRHCEPQRYFADFFTAFLGNVLVLNSRAGFFLQNRALLNFLSELFRKTETTALQAHYREFYFSDTVLRAYLLNTLVIPREDGDADGFNGSISDPCREMFCVYLQQRAEVLGLEGETQPPYLSYELFAAKDAERYYRLLQINGADGQMRAFYRTMYAVAEAAISSQNASYALFRTEDEPAPDLPASETQTTDAADASQTQETSAADALRTLKNDDTKASLAATLKELFSLKQKMLAFPNAVKSLYREIRAIFGVENCGVILQCALSETPSSENLLSCGLLSCELFDLLRDISLACARKQEKSEEKGYSFNGSFLAKSYRLIDDLVHSAVLYSPEIDPAFTDFTAGIETAGDIRLFFKCCVLLFNRSVSDSNEKSLIGYMKTYPHTLWLKSQKYEKQDISALLQLAFDFKNNFTLEEAARYCGYLTELPALEAYDDEAKDFVRFVLSPDPPALAPEEREAFIDKLSSYENGICYLIFNQLVKQDEQMLKYAPGLQVRLMGTNYLNGRVLLVRSVDHLDGAEKRTMIAYLAKNLDYHPIYSPYALQFFRTFYRNHAAVVDAAKGVNYSEDAVRAIETRLIEINMRKLADLAEHLQHNVNDFLYEYANQIYGIVRSSQPAADGARTLYPDESVEALAARFNELHPFLPDGEKQYLCTDYLRVIEAGAQNKVSVSKSKILVDLISVLRDMTIRILLPDQTRAQHVNLLVYLLQQHYA